MLLVSVIPLLQSNLLPNSLFEINLSVMSLFTFDMVKEIAESECRAKRSQDGTTSKLKKKLQDFSASGSSSITTDHHKPTPAEQGN